MHVFEHNYYKLIQVYHQITKLAPSIPILMSLKVTCWCFL